MNRPPPWLVALRAALGAGAFAWELGVDDLHHWPLFVLCFWLLGGPVEALIQFFTSGRIQINVRRRDEDEADPPAKTKDEQEDETPKKDVER